MAWPKSTKTVRIRKGNLYSADCPTRFVLDHVMSRWGSLVVVLLMENTYRFSELAYLIGGVSEKMLAQTLRVLEEDGFVLRKVYPTKPPRVEYSLTPFGRELAEHVRGLAEFVQTNVGKVMTHRAKAERMPA
jgi:DNA-binding HxlR family transcriptional regulator